ncbi:piggyBac transposable element-derived protein 4-like [Sipha flava]|uniref:PiggyBac transposable element-derived protein 4-like n=1 Tax=Sipha flava TaxID=143950 RepID=A0A8B8GUE2_9HEMI|nr:piggyBac transposable element-derived protein 4-like [Sipha flava]
MNFQDSPSTSSNTQKSMKTNILSDSELLDILEKGKFSSDEDFGIDSNDDDDVLDIGNLSDENEIDNEDNNSCSIDNNLLSCNENQYDWLTKSPTVENIFSIGIPGLKYIPEGDQPIDYFNFLFTDELLDLLVEETNAYAVDILLSTTSNNARISTWFDTNKSEMKLFFSLLFHMGTIKLARIEDYWKTNILLRALHFSRNPKEEELATKNRLYKIQPILDYFNSKMKEIYEPSKNLSIDESMVLWRDRLIFRQYIQNKRHKYGVKMYMLTEPWGLIHRVMVYSGQGHDVSEDLSHTEFVVDNLMNGLLYTGRSLFMDNFYNSVKLSRNLLIKKTYVTGTLRQNRKNNPIDVIRQKLKKGESICRYTSDGICVVKLKDKRDVLMISTEFPHEMIEIYTKKEVKKKPISVKNYNEHMSGIDRQDQMSSYYPFERKTLRWLAVIQGLLLDSQNIPVNSKKRYSETHLPLKVQKNSKKSQAMLYSK